jgi:hypothetical protein
MHRSKLLLFAPHGGRCATATGIVTESCGEVQDVLSKTV